MGEPETLMIVGPATADGNARDVLVSADDLDEVLKPLRAAAPEKPPRVIEIGPARDDRRAKAS
jgi:hypothetical protein